MRSSRSPGGRAIWCATCRPARARPALRARRGPAARHGLGAALDASRTGSRRRSSGTARTAAWWEAVKSGAYRDYYRAMYGDRLRDAPAASPLAGRAMDAARARSPASPARTARTWRSCCSSKGYHVVGMVRRASTENFERIAHLRDRVELRQADLLDQLSLIDLLKAVRPTEIYNLAAHVVRADVVAAAGAHRRVRRRRRHAPAGSDAAGRARGPLLPGQLERDVRQGRARRRSGRRRRSIRAARTASRRSTATTSR